jgi:peptidoglycan/xylan/chitin deacetylase (PgdA/CDA1 family)
MHQGEIATMQEAEQLQFPLQTQIIRRGNTSRAEIALTFDDGPCTPYTLHILDILRFYRVQATFFCLGKNVRQFPKEVEQMQKEGHLVENHAWSHQALTEISAPDDVIMELVCCTDAIEHATGVQPTFFRPPYGKYDTQVLSYVQACHMIPVLWTVDSRDWEQLDADTIYQNSIEQMKNGTILLLHDGEGDRSSTVEALPRIIEWARKHHMRMVTLRQIIS